MSVGATTGTSGSAAELQFDYLNLLVTQLQNQNPLDPMDTNEMSSQLTQFAQLEQLQGLNTSFGKVLAATQVGQAATLVGKEIGYYASDDDSARTGTVDSVEFVDGEVLLMVGDEAVSLEDVIAVGG